MHACARNSKTRADGFEGSVILLGTHLATLGCSDPPKHLIAKQAIKSTHIMASSVATAPFGPTEALTKEDLRSHVFYAVAAEEACR
jgi:hypothetical protein